jgi:hypothetical protein
MLVATEPLEGTNVRVSPPVVIVVAADRPVGKVTAIPLTLPVRTVWPRLFVEYREELLLADEDPFVMLPVDLLLRVLPDSLCELLEEALVEDVSTGLVSNECVPVEEALVGKVIVPTEVVFGCVEPPEAEDDSWEPLPLLTKEVLEDCTEDEPVELLVEASPDGFELDDADFVDRVAGVLLAMGLHACVPALTPGVDQ